MEVVFEGGTWILSSSIIDTLDVLSHFFDENSLLKQLIQGFLLTDFQISMFSYFTVTAFIWSLHSLPLWLTISASPLLISSIPKFLPPKSQKSLDKPDSFRLAFMVFLTFHRIKTFMSLRKLAFIVSLLSLGFYVFGRLSGFLISVIFSSILIQTDTLISRMRITSI